MEFKESYVKVEKEVLINNLKKLLTEARNGEKKFIKAGISYYYDMFKESVETYRNGGFLKKFYRKNYNWKYFFKEPDFLNWDRETFEKFYKECLKLHIDKGDDLKKYKNQLEYLFECLALAENFRGSYCSFWEEFRGWNIKLGIFDDEIKILDRMLRLAKMAEDDDYVYICTSDNEELYTDFESWTKEIIKNKLGTSYIK